MKTDIEIAQAAEMLPIGEVAAQLGLREEDLNPYGRYKAKVDHRLVRRMAEKPDAKVVLVTAISPTPAGEGKTTTSVGLADALHRMGKRAVLALREPSLGPVFGIKGGAAGGGYAQVVPMEDINLHFTGDLHAIGAANNLLAAMLDNHIYQGNALHIDPRRITWKRCVDMNDRQLRFVTDGLGGRVNGVPREDGFDITVASEVMAIFCLASDLADLKARLARIVVAYTYEGEPVTAGQLGAAGAMAALLKDAFDPNLVQTLEHTPALIHGGPFANIAHGCNSVIATRLAMKLGDIVVTEAGFGADLGAEKFLDIKCRMAGIAPSAAVVVATVRALKHHGGCPKTELGTPSVEHLAKGAENLARHVQNLREVYGLPVCVAVNAFPTDSAEEHAFLADYCANWACRARSARCSPRAARAASRWRGPCWTSWRTARCISPTNRTRPSRTSCAASRSACTMRRTSCSSPRRRKRWPSSRKTATGTCPCAWRKRSTASRTTRRSWPRPKTSP